MVPWDHLFKCCPLAAPMDEHIIFAMVEKLHDVLQPKPHHVAPLRESERLSTGIKATGIANLSVHHVDHRLRYHLSLTFPFRRCELVDLQQVVLVV